MRSGNALAARKERTVRCKAVRGPFGAIAVGVFAVLVGAAEARATVITFQNSFEFSRGTAPAGSPPWVTTTFDDGGTTGSVTMTLTATNLAGSEFVGAYFLNLDPLLDPNQLTFSGPSKVGSFTDPMISLGANSFKADGGGYFDIKLDFATSGGAASRFTSGDSVLYTITGPSLTADSFNFLSQQHGGQGTYFDAAHIQAIGPNSLSGWDTTLPPVLVPEPACVSLLALGGLAGILRRRR